MYVIISSNRGKKGVTVKPMRFTAWHMTLYIGGERALTICYMSIWLNGALYFLRENKA